MQAIWFERPPATGSRAAFKADIQTFNGRILRRYVPGAGIGPKCNPRYTEFIDFIVLNEDAATRKTDGSFFETTFSSPRERHPSDHYPIALDSRIPR